ncbi:MAG: DUF3427 domain-containing protein [Nitrospira sp. SB0666_bin_27]|nr:DUF3427 domain-containing protein [Nitrospira sp. SB0666_bin_27]MYF23679.1 DUF3427 domain-containing protein [Nitrospira sp. SB0678_bin_10]
MSLSDITSPQPVLDAIAEFDRLGRNRFLKKYGFGRSRSYWLFHNGKQYDSKPIVGAAHGYARPNLGPLRPTEFMGGIPVKRTLEHLGFRVAVNDPAPAPIVLTSDQLTLEKIYTRDDLRILFSITDATLNTGIFSPKGTSSVWLFITEEKTADRTPYSDQLQGDLLYWQGQMSSRKDALIINHQTRGLELLVFFRKKKSEYPGFGFRYLGPFVYSSHTGNKPTNFVLQRKRDSACHVPPTAADADGFDPMSVEDAREWISSSITQRRGQKRFRDDLISSYNGQCAITGCSVLDVLEAAHIYPYRGPDTNRVTNGLLLRSDIHTLFDCGLLAIDPDAMTVLVSPQLRESEYGALHGRSLCLPESPAQQPSTEALKMQLKTSVLKPGRLL